LKKELSQTLEVERLFSSYGRSKIISILIEYGELNITEIIKKSGLSHTTVSNHLSFLVKAGIVNEKRFNRIRIFRLDYSSPLVSVLQNFFSEWKEARSISNDTSINQATE
jgi:DNA-binding transcriptional ArsR family regulator